MVAIKKILVELFNAQGQQVYNASAPYRDGPVDISRLAKGNYILVINSEDGKYRHIQKVIKQ